MQATDAWIQRADCSVTTDERDTIHFVNLLMTLALCAWRMTIDEANNDSRGSRAMAYSRDLPATPEVMASVSAVSCVIKIICDLRDVTRLGSGAGEDRSIRRQ